MNMPEGMLTGGGVRLSVARLCLLGAVVALLLVVPGSEGWAGAVGRGDRLAAEHRLRSAIQQYRQAAEHSAWASAAGVRLGQTYLRLGRYQEAVDLLRQAETAGSTGREVMLGLAAGLEGLGGTRSSLEVLRRELWLRPGQAGVWARLVERAASAGLAPSEIEDLLVGLPKPPLEAAGGQHASYLLAACVIGPESRDGRLALRSATLGPDAAAKVRALELLAAVEGSDPGGRAVAAARVLLAQGLVGPALACLEGAPGGGPTGAEALALRAYGLMKLGRLEDAWTVLRRSLELEPDLALGEHLMGVLLRRRGDAEEGVKWLQRAARWEPGNPAYLMELGKALAEVGDYGNAERILGMAVAAAPEDAGLRLAAARFHVDRQYRVESALPNAREAVRLMGRTAETLATLGWATHLVGKPGEAVDLLREAVARDPESALLRYRLGSVYEALGQLDRAREQYLMVWELDGSGDHWRRAQAALEGLSTEH